MGYFSPQSSLILGLFVLSQIFPLYRRIPLKDKVLEVLGMSFVRLTYFKMISCGTNTQAGKSPPAFSECMTCHYTGIPAHRELIS